MSEPQFERMEPRAEAAASACAACQRTIPDRYFEAGGKVFCPACKDAVQASLTGGSGSVRLMKAALFGSVAAAGSAAAWYGIVKLTGYELGIVAVVVGLLVGGAVRMGAERRGGWVYQALAVLLTYVAIATSYVPMVMESLREEAAKESGRPRGDEPLASSAEAAPASEAEGAVRVEAANPVPALVFAVLFSLALPVLQVMDGGLIGVLIVGFALYEAWKVNKRQRVEFSGPFQLQRGPGTSPA